MGIPIILTTKATIHAITHCPTTTPDAHRAPNSLLIEAMAATHGVYKRQKTSRLAAPSGFSISAKDAVLPNSTDSVDTTLSFAIKPVINAVEILQSPNPRGANNGAI